MTEPHNPGARWPTLLTALCFVVPLAAYLSTAARTVQGGDAGEFGSLGFLGGVAHPTGYPLYSLLLRLAAHVPWGPPFFRVAATSAFCGAATVAVIQRGAWRFSGSLIGATAAALTFAFAPLQWRVSGIPEVFTLNALAAAVIMLLSLRIVQTPSGSAQDVFFLGLTCGLGLTNHLTLIWCAPLVLWAVFSGAPRTEWWPRLGRLCAGGLLGLLPYGLLPIFARTSPAEAAVWGETTTWPGFLTHVLRRDYGTFRLAPTQDHALFHLDPIRSFMETLPDQFTLVPLLLGMVGLLLAARRRGTGALLLSFVLSGIFFISLFNMNLPRFVSLAIEERFHLLPLLLLVPFVAVGFGWLLGRLPTAVGCLAVVALGVTLGFLHFPAANWKRETVIEDYAQAAIHNLPEDSVLVGSSDTWFSATRWVTQVERNRPDVHYVDLNLAHFPWYADRLVAQISRFPKEALGKEPWKVTLYIAASDHPTYVLSWDKLDRSQLATQPEGFVDRVVKPGTPPRPLAEQEADLSRATTELRPFRGPPVDVHSALVRRMASKRWSELADRYSQSGDASGAERCRTTAAALYPD